MAKPTQVWVVVQALGPVEEMRLSFWSGIAETKGEAEFFASLDSNPDKRPVLTLVSHPVVEATAPALIVHCRAE